MIERQIVRDQPIEDALAAASAALSGLSQAAGVVLAPKSEMRLKQLGLVPLGPDRALAVLVGADGSIENRIVQLDGMASADALNEVTNFINAQSVRHDPCRGAGAAAGRNSRSPRSARPRPPRS